MNKCSNTFIVSSC